MNAKQLAIVGSIVAAVLIAVIVLLVTGGPPPGALTKDPKNDVEVGGGEDPPGDTTLADVRVAKVDLVASQIVFEAEMAAPIPKRLKDQSMEWRWEILEGGTQTWVVTASISVDEPVASVLQQATGYGASTVDQTLAGGVDFTDRTLFVRLNAQQIPGFPTAFTWRLTTSLDADRADPASAVATDTAPASGLGEYPPPS